MSEITQRTQLQAAIWRIADDVRGAVDGWDFKQFVLGASSTAISAKILLPTWKAATPISTTLNMPTAK